MHIHGIDYEFTRGSDVSSRDGMFLEVSIKGSRPLVQVAEIFYSDQSGRFFVNCFVPDVPMELIEHLITQAKQRLPPVTPAP